MPFWKTSNDTFKVKVFYQMLLSRRIYTIFMNVLLHYRPLNKTLEYLWAQRDNGYVSYLASIHREDREAIGVATIPLLKSPPRDRVLPGVGIYFQPENPIQVLRNHRIRITYSLALALSQKIFPFKLRIKKSRQSGGFIVTLLNQALGKNNWPPDTSLGGQTVFKGGLLRE